MKASTIFALLVFLGLAAGVGYVTTRKPERGIARISLAQADVSSIDHVDLSGKTKVSLHKDGDRWLNDKNKVADADAVKQLLEAIPKIESDDQVTSAPDRYAELEVDDAKGTHVVARAGARTVADFVVGKSSGGATAVRVGAAIYRVGKMSPYVFTRDASAWLDRKLFRDKAEAVMRLEVRLQGQKPYALVKKDSDWAFEDPSVLPKGFRYDKGIATSLVSQLVSAQAKDVLDADPGNAATHLDDASDVWILSAKDDSGIEAKRELRLGAPLADKSVYARVAGKEDVFTLPEYLAKSLRKQATDFRDLTLMKLEPAKVEELTITADKMKLVLQKAASGWKIATSSETVPKDFDFDPAAVERRIAQWANSRAVKLAEGLKPSETGLGSPSAKLVAKVGKGTVSLLFGKQIKGSEAAGQGNQDFVYAKGNADGETYLVTPWIKSNLTGGVQSFKRQPMPQGGPGIDPNQLAKLPPDVRAQLMQQLAQRGQHPPIPTIQAKAPPPPPHK